MPLWELEEWLDEHDRPNDVLWYVKRLSGNDTRANRTHQAGPYIPKHVLFNVLPSLERGSDTNPRETFEMAVDSHHDTQQVTAIWYNNKSRNEARITGHGGADSALLDPESTAALTVFAFWRETDTQPLRCHVWIARDVVEEDVIEDRVGPVESGQTRVYPDLFSDLQRKPRCWLDEDDVPPEWIESYPPGGELVAKALQLRPEESADVDHRLVVRRECEFEIYKSLEHVVEMPRIREGFGSVDEFLEVAQPISQRRRSRGGRSLELHVKAIFHEEKLVEGVDFSYQPVVDSNRRPDFVFPSESSYKDASFPSDRLRMLAVKSTMRERWRQILEEAVRINRKHLLTLQRGVSAKQFEAIQEAGIQLVVPERLQSSYRKDIQPHLQTLESFLGDVRALRP